MSRFIRNGDVWMIKDEKTLDVQDRLAPGNYTIKRDAFGSWLIQEIDSFKPLTKYYGDVLKNTDRIMRTFEDRTSGTGVLLSGEKGSGKTLLAKNLAMEGAKRGYPTLVISEAWAGEEFNQLIQDIEQPTIILFDEFEKVYADRVIQEKLLTLLDGTYNSKKLFLLTCNDRWVIGDYMRNRPGRVYYSFDYKGLEPAFIREYCEDNLLNKDYINQVVNLSSVYNTFNFDMLKAIVEEMNRYNETAAEVIKFINARPENERSSRTYKVVSVTLKGVPIKYSNPSVDGEISFNPIVNNLVFEMFDPDNLVLNEEGKLVGCAHGERPEQSEDSEYYYRGNNGVLRPQLDWEMELEPGDIVQLSQDGCIVYKHEDFEIVLQREDPKQATFDFRYLGL